MKIGDTVQWTSSAAGNTRTKTGEVVEVIRAGDRPKMKGVGLCRDHESYVVRAKVLNKNSWRKYWPRVSALKVTAW